MRPFASVLARQGHTVIDVAHGHLERGKDIITRAPDGQFHAYQLKAGDIGMREYDSMKGELDRLVQATIRHPNVPEGAPFRAHLVTNGKVTGNVLDIVNVLNEDNRRLRRRFAHLEVVQKEQLTGMFVAAQGSFLPERLAPYRRLLDFLSRDGTELFPVREYAQFLNETLFASAPRSKTAGLNTIRSAVVVTAYALVNYEAARNHYARFCAWTYLSCAVERYGRSHTLGDAALASTLSLVVSEAEAAAEELSEDALRADQDFMVGAVLGDGGMVRNARRLCALGVAASLEIQRHPDRIDTAVVERFEELVVGISVWGESAFPYLLALVHLFERGGKPDVAQRLLLEYASIVTSSHGEGSSFPPLPDLYHDIEQSLRLALRFDSTMPDAESFRGTSMTLLPLIHMLTRRNARGLVNAMWTHVADVAMWQFVPQDELGYLEFSSDHGANETRFMACPQSWAVLRQEAMDAARDGDPFAFAPSALRWALLVMPHRLNSRTAGALDMRNERWWTGLDGGV